MLVMLQRRKLGGAQYTVWGAMLELEPYGAKLLLLLKFSLYLFLLEFAQGFGDFRRWLGKLL